MNEVTALLAAFLEATGREAAIWERREGSVTPTLLGSSSDTFAQRTEAGVRAWDVATWARAQALHAQLVTTGEGVGWLFVEPGHAADADRLLGRLVPLMRRLTRERDGATRELVERYEEINLLYAIGELLGSSTSVESVADTLLAELAETVGATRAVFLQTNRSQGILRPIAALGLGVDDYAPVHFDATGHIAVRAFRSSGASTEDGIAGISADPVLAPNGEPLLAVAITRPSSSLHITGSYPAVGTRRGADPAPPIALPLSVPMSSAPLGVLVLAGRRGGHPFTAGDRKLALAVSTQVGTAMHNATLVRAAVERQQLARELLLAQELQLKLMPKPAVVRPEARAAARVEAAESVGGDFYLLARLDQYRTGVLIGDVSGHGYQSALIMALALSASAIHVQAAFDPSIAVEAVQRSLQDELESTEMSVSMCYAVIDSRAQEVRYANAGHPHCFKLSADGQCVRMGAVAPPLGFGSGTVEESVMRWRAGDRLVFLTDGVIDARDVLNTRLSEAQVIRTLEATPVDATPDEIVAAVFARVDAHIGRTPLKDDCTVVVVDRP
jgi:sigma-B regulation protein RsbU (phosphoserine phosphatase)